MSHILKVNMGKCFLFAVLSDVQFGSVQSALLFSYFLIGAFVERADYNSDFLRPRNWQIFVEV